MSSQAKPQRGGKRENQTGRPPLLKRPALVSVYVEADVAERIARKATAAGTSASAEVRRLLGAALARGL